MKRVLLIGVGSLLLFFLNGCSYTSHLLLPLIPDASDFAIVEDAESAKGPQIPENNVDYDTSTIDSIPFETPIFLDNERSDITGAMSYSLQNAEVFINLYDAGFTMDQVGYPQDPVFPYHGSPHFYDIFDETTGDFLSGIGLLRIDIKISNMDAWNAGAEHDYGNGYLFDIRQFYMADFSILERLGGNCIQCTGVMMFSALGVQKEGSFLYQLSPGEEVVFSLGYLVNLDSVNSESIFLCNHSAFLIPDELNNIMLIALNFDSEEFEP